MRSNSKWCALLIVVSLSSGDPSWSFESGRMQAGGPTTVAQAAPAATGADVVALGKTSASSTYPPQTEGDLFRGGRWCGSRNGQDWIQRDFSATADIAEIRIGRAGTDVSTEGSRMTIKLLRADGKWVVIDELQNTNINWSQLSFGKKGRSLTSYRKVLQPPIKAAAFRLELSGNGWFNAADIQLITARQKQPDVQSLGSMPQATKPDSGKAQATPGAAGQQDARNAPNSAAGTSRFAGDCNGNGGVDAADALDALKMSVGLVPGSPVCDMDGNGEVTSTDARLILQEVVSK